MLGGLGTRAAVVEADICVYGGTSGGVVAAVQAARMGKKIVLVEPGRHLGGMTSGGLSAVDIGDPRTVGGLARECFSRLVASYGNKLEWDQPFSSKAGGPATGGAYSIEPHVAERVFDELVREAKVPVYRNARLAELKKQGTRIAELVAEDGTVFRAKMFIDATYEGDLMPGAKVSYTLKREANGQYQETLNGVQFHSRFLPEINWGKPGPNGRRQDSKGIWDRDIPLDPYVIKGQPQSGVLPLVQADELGPVGSEAPGVQAYCYRLCLTTNAANQIPITAPAGYDAKRYELVARFIEACVAAGDDLDLRWFSKYDALPNGKWDFNTATFGGNLPGASWAWPEANGAKRAEIAKDHENYHRGLLYFLGHDPRVPAKVRADMLRFGLCKDEFPDTGGWPHQLYVREARRMISDFVMTEHHVNGPKVAADSVGIGSYGIDVHEIRRVIRDGTVIREGKLASKVNGPYPIAYASIVPKANECENLFVTFALSATHVAFASIRMEPAFMILSQSAATAACLAIDDGVPVQRVPYAKLQPRLLADKQVLEWKPASPKKEKAPPAPEKKAAANGPLPVVDLSGDAKRQVVIAQGTADYYQGHPTTLLLPDGKTMFVVWTHGHGGTCGLMKRSDDGGLTWSDLLPVPDNWKQVKNCPAIYRLTDPKGVTRLFVFAGSGPDGAMQQAYSTDNGKTWTPMKGNGLVCVMPFCTIMPVDGGKKLIGLSNIRRPGDTKDKRSNVVTQSESTDGGLTWSSWRILVDLGDLKPCEPEVVRSPDGKQLLCLIRENVRTEPAHFITSDDEGRTWSPVKALPSGLHGDRHKAVYTPDGRLVVCFRDTGANSPTKNHFAAWVGHYEDIVAGRAGDYKIKLLHSHKAADCGYPGVELLPDGTVVATTYIKYRATEEQNSVVSTRFKLAETDKLTAELPPPAPVTPPAQGAANASQFGGLVLDDGAAEYTRAWVLAEKLTPLLGTGYRYADRKNKLPATAKFVPDIPEPGQYEVRLLYVPADNRARKVKVTVTSVAGEKTLTLNQREPCIEDGIPRALGIFEFAKGKAGAVEISSEGADGYVIVDGLQLVPEDIAKAERATRVAATYTPKPAAAAAVKVPPPMLLANPAKPAEVDGKTYDLVVVGGTPGGIACAVRAAREGLRVLLVNHTKHLGGFVTSGAGGWEAPYDGLRSPLYGEMRTLGAEYYRKAYGENSPQHLASLPSATSRAHIDRPKIEPRIAEKLFNEMVEHEKTLSVLLDFIVVSAEREGNLLKSIKLQPRAGGAAVKVNAQIFADGMYEGDLMAVAGVKTQIGREARSQYNEPHAGIVYTKHHERTGQQRGFPKDADEGRLNIRYNSHATGDIVEAPHSGEADSSVMAYNYRLILTKAPANRLPVEKPANFDLATAKAASGGGFVPHLPNQKVAWNGGRLIGPHNGYPGGDWATREKISQQYIEAMLMHLWWVQNDPAAPKDERKQFAGYGLAADEFPDNQHLPYEIYVREARRLVGRYVFVEHDNLVPPGLGRTPVHADSVAMTDWPVDSVACTTNRVPDASGDGIVFLGEESRPAQVPYRTMLAKEVDNLLVPVALSASHIGWGSIRLEPVWMQTGEAAGFAAVLAVKAQCTPGTLKPELLIKTLAKNRVMITFFNDIDVASKDPRVPAAEYFGTQGFLADYNARLDEPLTESLRALWEEGFRALRQGKLEPAKLAASVFAAEAKSSPPTQTKRGDFLLQLWNQL